MKAHAQRDQRDHTMSAIQAFGIPATALVTVAPAQAPGLDSLKGLASALQLCSPLTGASPKASVKTQGNRGS